MHLIRFRNFGESRSERFQRREDESRMERRHQLHLLIKDAVKKGIKNPIYRLRERQYRNELNTL